MTESEKAKAYDKALEVLHKYDGANIMFTQDLKEEMFPELKESKDERIRKELIRAFKSLNTIKVWNGIERTDILAWLERQISQDNAEDVDILHRFSFYSYKDEPNVLYLSGVYVNEEYRNKGIGTKILEVADEVAKSLDCYAIRLKTKKDSDAERLYRTHAYNSLATEDKDEIWLEKQGEQKPYGQREECSDCEFRCGDKCIGSCAMKRGEQEPTNKVEPKFKVGDWIIGRVTNNEPRQISEIIDQCYKSTYGGQYGFSYEDEMHLWTIQDAKDGDVLVDKDNNIGIYKEIEGIYWDSYIYLGCNGELRGFSIGGKHEQTNTHPATKEQRDKLEKAMADDGYEWDAEKKELKKIEQKSVEWSDADEVMLNDCISVINCANISNDKKEIRNWLKSLKDRCLPQPKQEWSEEKRKEFIGEIQSLMFEWSNKKENMGVCIDRHIDKLLSIVSDISDLKPAWSEEDEDYYNAIIVKLEVTQEDAALTDNQMKFLKSLKDRVRLQPKQEWSKEDKYLLSSCISIFERIGDGDLIKGNKDDANKYISFLKFLRPQKQQHDDEWSDEDKEFLKWTLSNLAELKDRYGEDYGKVGKCIDWLNSLQPQPIDVEAAIAYQEGYQKAVVEFSQKQQEWTDEDINMIDWLIRCCEKEHEELCNDRYGHQEIVSDLKRDCRKKWDWLESLKGKVAPQKQWKPSEEQMKAVEEALSLAKNCGEEYSFDLRKLLEQLKAL